MTGDEGPGPDPDGRQANDERRRVRTRWFAVGGFASLVVATIFATVGDGVEVPEATGVRAWLVEHAHVVTWGLLAAAFFSATGRAGWNQTSQSLAVGAGVAYLVFLAAVLVF